MESSTTKALPPPSVKEIGIIFTDNNEVRSLNRRYRKLDKTTDVLSFSMTEGLEAENIGAELGDIVISVPMAIAQSRRFGGTLEKELLRLIIHGCLHLFGYDHVKVSKLQVKLMKDLEERLIRKYD